MAIWKQHITLIQTLCDTHTNTHTHTHIHTGNKGNNESKDFFILWKVATKPNLLHFEHRHTQTQALRDCATHTHTPTHIHSLKQQAYTLMVEWTFVETNVSYLKTEKISQKLSPPLSLSPSSSLFLSLSLSLSPPLSSLSPSPLYPSIRLSLSLFLPLFTHT